MIEWYFLRPPTPGNGPWCTVPHDTTASKILHSCHEWLKVLMPGAPILSLDVNMLRRWLISKVCWGGFWPWGLATPHPLSHLGLTSSSLGAHLLLPPGPLSFHQGDAIKDMPSPVQDISVWKASNASCNWLSSRFWTSLVGSVWDVDSGAPNKPSSKLGTRGRGYMPTPLLWVGIWAPNR